VILLKFTSQIARHVPLCPVLCLVSKCLFYFFSFIHMCIQCLGHFSPLPPAPSLTSLLPPSPCS
jgi:hypothetical protein